MYKYKQTLVLASFLSLSLFLSLCVCLCLCLCQCLCFLTAFVVQHHLKVCKMVTSKKGREKIECSFYYVVT